MLNEAEVRPLDYDYLIKLKPGPQRLYELLSFQIYGAIASGRPRAKLLYSEYCMCAPQVRYLNFDGVKKQMYKIHLPHRESGYISKVAYSTILDRDGKADWEMLYTPGPRAMMEYQAFTNRQVRQRTIPSVPQPILAKKTRLQPIQSTLDLSAADTTLAAELTQRGISKKMADELLSNLKPGQEPMDQIQYYDHLRASDIRGKIASPTGLLVTLIRDNTAVPPDFPTSRKLLLRQQAQQDHAVKAAHHSRLRREYEDYHNAQVAKYISDVLSPEAFQKIFERIQQTTRRDRPLMTTLQVDALAHQLMQAEVKQSGQAVCMSFEEFSRSHTA